MNSKRPSQPHLVHGQPLRLWMSAVTSLIVAACFTAAPVFLVLGFMVEKQWLIWALGALLLMAVTIVLFLLLATRVHCRVCRNPLLIEKPCNKHPKAKSLLGSYVLRSSLRTATTGTCGCMYCGEPNFVRYSQRRAERRVKNQEAFQVRRENLELEQILGYQTLEALPAAVEAAPAKRSIARRRKHEPVPSFDENGMTDPSLA